MADVPFFSGRTFFEVFYAIRRCIPLLLVSVLFFQLQRVFTLEFHSFYYEINSYFVFIFVFFSGFRRADFRYRNSAATAINFSRTSINTLDYLFVFSLF